MKEDESRGDLFRTPRLFCFAGKKAVTIHGLFYDAQAV
jgi:hypothetical protein